MDSPLELFLVSLIIGVSVAAPIGPIGVLCLRRTLAESPLTGLASGLGAATVDALYSAVAGLGLTFISGALTGHRSLLEVAGGIALCYLGFSTFFSGPVKAAACVEGKSLVSAYASAFLLTALNPYTVIFFMAAFAALGLPCPSGDCGRAYIMVMGIFAGSSSWWVALSVAAGSFRSKLTENSMAKINRLAGGVIFCAGLGAMISGIFRPL